MHSILNSQVRLDENGMPLPGAQMRARLVTINGAGHGLLYEFAEESTKHIVDFLNSN